jgi:hypothetical protein
VIALSRFRRCTRGNVAILFGLLLLPLLGFAGSLVDYTRLTLAETELQAAADATALALAREANRSTIANHVANKARSYLEGELKNTMVDTDDPSFWSYAWFDGSTKQVRVGAAVDVNTVFMHLFRIKKTRADVRSYATWNSGDLEIVFALDNTGSMADFGKMAALKDSMSESLSSLKGMAGNGSNIKVGIVPFATQVNIGGCISDREQNWDVSTDAPDPKVPGSAYVTSRCNSSIAPTALLTSDLNTLDAIVDGMSPNGNTNVTIGLVTGLALLNPSNPYGTQSTRDPNTKKFLVVLTDGDNTQNLWSHSQMAIDQRTNTACNVAKAAQPTVTIYTIRVIQGNAALLQACASSPDKYFGVTNSSQLRDVFAKIVNQIGDLRLAR